ncbi:gluconokinase [Fodinicola feengrottensis]|uniref:Gluconokinase n=1 Tax=Fodinicola feengrottensis TaxID=435914 RepID=A0ABN2HNT1_9ACTN|nr:gluconokinase [Fodinicola feengrottensis]
MGVSSSGKSTVGRPLAERLGVPFAEADDFHPAANITKMSRGEPLTDHDRWPWLEAIAGWIHQHQVGGGVVTCSALKRAYRDVLRANNPATWFLHLSGRQELVTDRSEHRRNHFMPASLVASQFADLEPLGADEPGLVVSVELPLGEIVDRAVQRAREQGEVVR